jgi:hypothetical protein
MFLLASRCVKSLEGKCFYKTPSLLRRPLLLGRVAFYFERVVQKKYKTPPL